MFHGIQTHIEGWTAPEELRFVREQRFTMARIAAMTCPDAVLEEMLRDTLAADLVPFITVADPERLRKLSGLDCEWRNEDDGDMTPAEYRRGLDDACAVAQAVGVRLWAPTISNLDRDSLAWLEQVRGSGWPEGLHGISAHRYGDGTFHRAHRWFFTREREVERLTDSCDGKPFVISEFGYPTLDGLTDAQQAERIGQEWAFWAEQGAYAAILFQIHDGPDPRSREHCYGIRHVNADGSPGDWKPSAFSIPNLGTIAPIQEIDMIADVVIHRACLIPLDSYGKPGKYSAYVKPEDLAHVIAVDDQGGVHANAVSQIGQAYETFSLSTDGAVAVFDESGALARGVRIV